jgi:hypothetical protein
MKSEIKWLEENTEYIRSKINSNGLLENVLSAMESRLAELEAAQEPDMDAICGECKEPYKRHSQTLLKCQNMEGTGWLDTVFTPKQESVEKSRPYSSCRVCGKTCTSIELENYEGKCGDCEGGLMFPDTPKQEPIKKSGKEWHNQYEQAFGMTICDPDGWRNDNLDIDEYVCTWEEFKTRALKSSQVPVNNPKEPKPGQFGRFWDDNETLCIYGQLDEDRRTADRSGFFCKGSVWYKHFEPLTEPTWEPPTPVMEPYIKNVDAFHSYLRRYSLFPEGIAWREVKK